MRVTVPLGAAAAMSEKYRYDARGEGDGPFVREPKSVVMLT